jgi:hypothetical protein
MIAGLTMIGLVWAAVLIAAWCTEAAVPMGLLSEMVRMVLMEVRGG